MNSKTLVLDFDKVICDTGVFKEGIIEGKPIKNSKKSLENLIKCGYKVIILTARSNRKVVKEWLEFHHFPDLVVTNIKPIAQAYVDDRAIRFTNWNDITRYFI